MQRTLRSTGLARLVLAWFVAFVGVSVAAPVLHPVSTDLVCSASGDVRLLGSDAADTPGGTHSAGMHCPLCLPVAATFSEPEFPVLRHPLLREVLRAPLPLRLASVEALSPQSRGPPAFS